MHMGACARFMFSTVQLRHNARDATQFVLASHLLVPLLQFTGRCDRQTRQERTDVYSFIELRLQLPDDGLILAAAIAFN